MAGRQPVPRYLIRIALHEYRLVEQACTPPHQELDCGDVPVYGLYERKNA
jgi:hypothetical protein